MDEVNNNKLEYIGNIDTKYKLSPIFLYNNKLIGLHHSSNEYINNGIFLKRNINEFIERDKYSNKIINKYNRINKNINKN